ncbi:MAG: response regulator transcription factor [Solirubrobacterales bacterium]|nr:response regulator transcription factor [Solirubrobacterales bacterium]
MSQEPSDALVGGVASATSQRTHNRLRLAVVDRDPGFMQVLSNRLDALGWDLRALSSAVTVDALVGMRLNALVVDLAVLGPGSWEYLERVCARLPGLAVIVCTGPSSVAQRVRGLRLGADAWMTKPCHAEELICVIEAAIRRHRRNDMPAIEDSILVGEIQIRPDLYQAYAGDKSLELTAREFEILHLLCQSDRVLRREEIYERVWGYAMAHGDRSVDVFVRKLRQKLRVVSPTWNYIHTHFGVGYRFAPEPDDAGVSAEPIASTLPEPALPGAAPVLGRASVGAPRMSASSPDDDRRDEVTLVHS